MKYLKQGSLVLFDWKAYKEDVRSYCEDNNRNLKYSEKELKYLQSFIRLANGIEGKEKVFEEDHPNLLGYVVKTPCIEGVVDIYFFSFNLIETCYIKFLKKI